MKLSAFRVIKAGAGAAGPYECCSHVMAKTARGAVARARSHHEGSPLLRVEKLSDGKVVRTWRYLVV